MVPPIGVYVIECGLALGLRVVSLRQHRIVDDRVPHGLTHELNQWDACVPNIGSIAKHVAAGERPGMGKVCVVIGGAVRARDHKTGTVVGHPDVKSNACGMRGQ
jgi:hypothetical protein